MAGTRVVTHHFARTGLLESFRRTLMCLQFRHGNFLEQTSDIRANCISLAQRRERMIRAGSTLLNDAGYYRQVLRAGFQIEFPELIEHLQEPGNITGAPALRINAELGHP
jgi:hypothetical protein